MRAHLALHTFVAVGHALRAIREQRLYRAEYPTFEAYCRERWEMERRHAYRLMDAAQVIENVSHGTQALPTNERQARRLAALPPDEQRAVWQEAVETAPDGKLTPAHVEDTPSQDLTIPLLTAPASGIIFLYI